MAQRPQQKSATGGGGREGESSDAPFHGPEGDITLGESPIGAQTVGPVGALEEVPKVVDQIGRALHQEREKEAQRGGAGPEASGGISQGRAYDGEDYGVDQAIRPYGQNPSC